MKRNDAKRAAAGLLALAMAAGLTACGSAESGSTAATAETADTATEETATSTVEEEYAYLADFSYADGFDENGYLKDVKALDYVTLPDDYDDLTIAADLGQVTDDDISSYIQSNVLANFSTTEQVTDRAAADGDTVNIDFVGSVDGEEFDGGSTNGSGYTLTLGSNTFIDDFEDQIVGHTPGETFDVNVTFPDDYGTEGTSQAELNGKDAVFSTTLNYISETVYPELTDDWVAENLGPTMELATVEDLNAFVKTTILYNQQSGEVYSALKEKATFADTLPESIGEYYNNVLLYSLYSYASTYGTSMATIVSASGYDSVDAYIEGMQDSVTSITQQALLLQAVAEKQGLTCDTKKLNADFGTYFGTTDPSQYVSAYGENYVKMNLLQTEIVQGLIDNVKYE